MKCEVREICGDWALGMDNFNGYKATIFFNSRQNALNVKRILEVDDSIPNAATVCAKTIPKQVNTGGVPSSCRAPRS